MKHFSLLLGLEDPFSFPYPRVEEEFEVILLNANETLSSLILKLSAALKREILHVSYIDCEKDEVSCDSECEFKELLKVVRDHWMKGKHTILNVEAGHPLPKFSRRKLKKIKMKSLTLDPSSSVKYERKAVVAPVSFHTVGDENGSANVADDVQSLKDVTCEQPPMWFINYMNKFKKSLKDEIMYAVQTSIKLLQEDGAKISPLVTQDTSVKGISECNIALDILDHNKQIESEHNYATSGSLKSQQDNVHGDVNQKGVGSKCSKIKKREDLLPLEENHKEKDEEAAITKDECDLNSDISIFGDDDFCVLSGEISVTDSDTENEQCPEDFMVVPMPSCFDGLQMKSVGTFRKKRCEVTVSKKQTEALTKDLHPALDGLTEGMKGRKKDEDGKNGNLSLEHKISDTLLEQADCSRSTDSTLPKEKQADLVNMVSDDVSLLASNNKYLCDVSIYKDIWPDKREVRVEHSAAENESIGKNRDGQSDMYQGNAAQNNHVKADHFERPEISPAYAPVFEQTGKQVSRPPSKDGFEGLPEPQNLSWMTSAETLLVKKPETINLMEQQNKYFEPLSHDIPLSNQHATLLSNCNHQRRLFANEDCFVHQNDRSSFRYYLPQTTNFYYQQPVPSWATESSNKSQTHHHVPNQVHQSSSATYQPSHPAPISSPQQLPVNYPGSQHFCLPGHHYVAGPTQQQEISSSSEQMMPSSPWPIPLQLSGNCGISSNRELSKQGLQQQSLKQAQRCDEPVTILPEKLMQIASSAVTTACNIVGSLGKPGSDMTSSGSATFGVNVIGFDGLSTSTSQPHAELSSNQNDTRFMTASNITQGQSGFSPMSNTSFFTFHPLNYPANSTQTPLQSQYFRGDPL